MSPVWPHIRAVPKHSYRRRIVISYVSGWVQGTVFCLYHFIMHSLSHLLMSQSYPFGSMFINTKLKKSTTWTSIWVDLWTQLIMWRCKFFGKSKRIYYFNVIKVVPSKNSHSKHSQLPILCIWGCGGWFLSGAAQFHRVQNHWAGNGSRRWKPFPVASPLIAPRIHSTYGSM